MTIYSLNIPSFYIAQIRSAHKDTLFASTGLRVMNATGGLHKDWGSHGSSLGDYGANQNVILNIPWNNVEVPEPTPDNPDGGSIIWTFLLVNQGHADITAAGFVAVINKAADAFAGALAGNVLGGKGADITIASFAGLTEILAVQELVNLMTANCDGTVAVGDVEFTAAQLAGMVPLPGQLWTSDQDNPGTNSPAGCGRNSDYRVWYHIQKTSGAWNTDDITATTAATAAAGDPSGYMFDAQGTQHVVYRGTDGHIHELYWNGAWNTDDITATTAATAAAGDPSGYMFDAQGTQHVVYRGTDGHIHELYWNGAWNTDDITATTAATAAAGDPSGYMFDAQGTQHVVYRGTDGHIHELYWNGAWNTDDITATTAATAAAGDPSGYMFDAQGTQHVVYRGTDGHIHELYWNGAWNTDDITATTAATAAAGDPSGYMFDAQGTQHVVYRGTDGHIHELYWNGAWNTDDITATTGATAAAGDPSRLHVRRPGNPARRLPRHRRPHSRAVLERRVEHR